MKKNVLNTSLFAVATIAATLPFTACGESTTSETTVQNSSTGVESVADIADLPKCTADNDGMSVLVRKEGSLRVCSGGDWYGIMGGNTTADMSCTTAELADKSGIKILCNGDSVGVVLNGAKGDQGEQGIQGEKGETGAQGVQGEKGETGAQGVQGEKGETGAQGVQGEKGDKGDTGATGAQGVQGEKGDKGDVGERGVAGAGCTVVTLADNSGLKVLCGGDSVGVVLNGEKGDKGDQGIRGVQGEKGDKGDTGPAGADAEGGSSCNLVNKDCVVHVACGKDTVSLEIYSDDESCKEVIELDEEAIATNLEGIGGTSQKGPFLTGSEVVANELLDGRTLQQTGKTFQGKILSDKGDFDIKTVSLASQYATLSAKGYYLNEVTGEPSKSQITLTALTNLRGRAVANINLLTHLENERAQYLVIVDKMTVAAAKKKAEAEVFNLFHIDSKDFAGYSEDLSVGGTSDADAALLAMSILLQGTRSEAELSALLTTISKSMEETGKWNDATTKVSIADWAAGADSAGQLPEFRENVAKWGLSQMVAKFEPYFRNYWYKTLGLADCTKENTGAVAQTTAGKYSGSSKTRFSCVDSAEVGPVWRIATDIEKDTYDWPAATVDGKQKPGSITGKTYVYDANGSYTNDHNPGWREPKDVQELDTYEWEPAEDGTARNGSVNTKNCYVYEGSLSAWRVGSAEECTLGYEGCTVAKECTYRFNGKDYYFCHEKTWIKSGVDDIALNTCGLEKDNLVHLGRVKTTSAYVFENDAWRDASKYETVAGKTCSDNNRYEIVIGKVDAYDGVVCDVTGWKAASSSEVYYGKSCTENNSGEVIVDDNGDTSVCGAWYQSWEWRRGDGWWFTKPENKVWNDEIKYGTLKDGRDHSVYKTVKIGDRIWMADDLRYADSVTTPNLRGQTMCLRNQYGLQACSVARFYSWTGAMDLDSVYSTINAKKMTKNPHRGICPEGWHIPDSLDWKSLGMHAGYRESNLISRMVRGNDLNRVFLDPLGFNAFPWSYSSKNIKNEYYFNVGYYYNLVYWGAHDVDHEGKLQTNSAFELEFNAKRESFYFMSKTSFLPVRCVRDTPATDED